MELTDWFHPVELAGWTIMVVTLLAFFVLDLSNTVVLFRGDLIVKFVAVPLIALGIILKKRD